MELLVKLNALYPFDTPAKRAEADALICREWIRTHPIPSVEQFDLEMEELRGR